MEDDGWRLGDMALEWIRSNIQTGSRILELGSGLGSKMLHDMGYRVISVEHDEKWLNKFPGIEYVYAPIKPHKAVTKVEDGTHEWYDKEVIATIEPGYSLIIVDGPPGSYGRSGFFKYLDLFDVTVPILFDDLHRQHELKLATRIAAKLERPLVHYCWGGKQWGVL